MLVTERVDALIEGFPRWLDAFDGELPFARIGQQDGHVATLNRWRELDGDVSALIRDDRYITTLYRTLQAWGIGRRGSRLVPTEAFQACLLRAEPRLISLQGVRISDEVVADPAFVAGLWRLIAELGIVENATFMVPGTKALHHMLPLLIVPIDRLYTGTFFGWSTARMQTKQPELFQEAYSTFSRVARAVDLGALTGPSWRMGEAKLIDNAIIGYCRAEGLMEDAVPKQGNDRPTPNVVEPPAPRPRDRSGTHP